MTLEKENENSINEVSLKLKNGEVVILPTDTVYGFSGIADIKSNNTFFSTDKKIRSIKGREESKPLIQLISKPEDIFLYTEAVIPPSLLSKWPGALTIIVPIKENSPFIDDYKTVAFRCPGDKWLRSIIEEVKAPIFSTSVNRSGKPVLDEIKEIKAEFEDEVSLIIDDSDKKGGLPSTLISILDGNIKVLRQGTVTI